MQTKMHKVLSIISIMIMALMFGNIVFAEQTIEFKDGMVVKGEIQNESLTVKTSFGTLTPPLDTIIFVSEGNVELKDGSKIAGHIVVDEKGFFVKTKYGTWTLHFTSKDIEMIMFQKD